MKPHLLVNNSDKIWIRLIAGIVATVFIFTSIPAYALAPESRFANRDLSASAIPKLASDEIAVSGLSLAKVFVGAHQGLAKRFQSEFNLPDAKTYHESELTRDVEGVRVTFYKRKSGSYIVWVFKKENKQTIAAHLKLTFKLDVPMQALASGEIAVSAMGLAEVFVGDASALSKRFKTEFNLPDAKTSQESELTRDAGTTRVTFYKRKSGTEPVWAFKEKDKRAIANILGLELRVDPQDLIDQLSLEEAIALLGDDPLKLHQYIMLYHPELSPEEIDRVVIASFRGLRSDLPEVEELHRDYEVVLDSPAITHDIPEATNSHSFLLEGRVEDKNITHIQVVDVYTRRIIVRQDGTFSANIPLPKTGGLNTFAVYGFNPDTKQKSFSATINIRQTSPIEDAEEAFRRLLSLRDDILIQIQRDPYRYNFLLRCVEGSLLKHFTYDEEEGLSLLKEKIEDERSPLQRAIFQAILAKFITIKDMDFKLKPNQRLYFFQKYCIYEVQELIKQGARGVIIANEQGLGKTITALAIINGHEAVIITPNAVVTTWAEQEEQFFPQPKMELLEGSYDEREQALEHLTRPQVVTNVEFTRGMTPRRRNNLSRKEGVLVVDEADYLGSKNSQQTQGTNELEAGFKLLLTATPFRRPAQINHLLGFLKPDDSKFRSAKAFSRVFNVNSVEDLNALFLLMQQHTLRIRKKDVFDEYDPSKPLEEQRDRLPRKVEISPEEDGRFDLTDEQCQSILELFTDYQEWCRKHKGHETDEDTQFHRYKEGYFSKKEALRQIMDNPAYVGVNMESPKHKKMDEIVKKELTGEENNGKKMLVFCRYKAQVEEYQRRYKAYGARTYRGGLTLDSNGYKEDDERSILYYEVDEYDKFILKDGRPIPTDKSHGRPIRALDYERIVFQNDPEARIMIATYDSGSVGVTFTAADAVVYDDLAPTYRDQYQAGDRAHRIDNTRKKYAVKYYWLQALYPKSFLSSLPDDIREEYFQMGTFDQIYFENIRRQGINFHRIMDGIGNPNELTEAANQGVIRNRMPFLFRINGYVEENIDETPEDDTDSESDEALDVTSPAAKTLDSSRSTRGSS